MILGYLYQGSGAGNQLHRYIATRIKVLEINTDWRMIYVPDGSGKIPNFKCQSFMQFDESKIITEIPKGLKKFNEKKITDNGIDIRSYDPEFNFIEDNTIIDGEFQDPRYFEHRINEIDEWLKVEPLDVPYDVCVIGFRGGEFAIFPDLFLTKEYWTMAVERIREENEDMKFEIHTDDPSLAEHFFASLLHEPKIIHDIGVNWRSMRYAKYAIIANSSFYILPRLLSKGITIAPRYWARHNTGVWALPQNYYKQFTYI